MLDLNELIQSRIAASDAKDADNERQQVRQAASDYLKKWGLDGTLPPGVPGDSGECVFAHALGGHWTGSTWLLSEERGRRLSFLWKGNPDEGYVLDLPPEVREFIARFDAGEYPDLIA